jgi:hypothetical protein
MPKGFDAFEAMMATSDRTKGLVVILDYTSDALTEMDAFLGKSGPSEWVALKSHRSLETGVGAFAQACHEAGLRLPETRHPARSRAWVPRVWLPGPYAAGPMFWFRRNALWGSYCFLSDANLA